MVALSMNVQSLNARDVASRLREAADTLERGDWEAVFLAHMRAAYAFGMLDSFCQSAQAAGSAPAFADVLAYAERVS